MISTTGSSAVRRGGCGPGLVRGPPRLPGERATDSWGGVSPTCASRSGWQWVSHASILLCVLAHPEAVEGGLQDQNPSGPRSPGLWPRPVAHALSTDGPEACSSGDNLTDRRVHEIDRDRPPAPHARASTTRMGPMVRGRGPSSVGCAGVGRRPSATRMRPGPNPNGPSTSRPPHTPSVGQPAPHHRKPPHTGRYSAILTLTRKCLQD